MKAIIVDDEPRAIDLLKTYLEHFESIELVGTFRNGLRAFEFLSNEHVDIMFLDINMPHISGISLAKILPAHIKVIFTTAHSDYAVESYEYRAVDFLLKPISLERFAKSVSKILDISGHPAKMVNTVNVLTIKSGFETYRIDSDQILYLEKDGNYMIYHFADQRIMARETVQESLEKLPLHFVQTHKSFIVNIARILRFDRNMLDVGQAKIPLSETFREAVLKVLEA